MDLQRQKGLSYESISCYTACRKPEDPVDKLYMVLEEFIFKERQYEYINCSTGLVDILVRFHSPLYFKQKNKNSSLTENTARNKLQDDITGHEK